MGKEKINLTAMWKAVDGRNSQQPSQWSRLPETKKFLESLMKDLNMGLSHIWETKRGNSGGTYGHWQLALEYARYLDKDFAVWCNKVIQQHEEFQADPERSG